MSIAWGTAATETPPSRGRGKKVNQMPDYTCGGLRVISDVHADADARIAACLASIKGS